ncbi:hypothetical protein Y88_3394 [Novosphingobium nitrogenifigens DSM 19370]|uniref:Uncharacterized protein n=1 Tax=Novosphingobium nitrogenifigens DSM 19370 TaxID=983920 RepID=F1Z3C2_9SPHN|nr:hypothetical protein Y88_3394 [Novosphingobium nitrogenifigens DSM 19370]
MALTATARRRRPRRHSSSSCRSGHDEHLPAASAILLPKGRLYIFMILLNVASRLDVAMQHRVSKTDPTGKEFPLKSQENRLFCKAFRKLPE